MKMKKKMILLVSLLLLAAAVLGGMPQDAWADTQSKEYVVDDAGLFTDKEKEQLTKMCRKASDACLRSQSDHVVGFDFPGSL